MQFVVAYPEREGLRGPPDHLRSIESQESQEGVVDVEDRAVLKASQVYEVRASLKEFVGRA